MTKPTLLVSTSAVLAPMPDGSLQPNSFSKSFMHWAGTHFKIAWTTPDRPHDGFRLNRTLELPESTPVHVHGDSKVKIFEGHPDFFLVDDMLIPSEASWVAEHGMAHHVITVDPNVGVTPETKDTLEGKLIHAHR